MTTETEDNWPLRLGYLAGRRGSPCRPIATAEMDADWLRGWALGNRQRLARDNARQRHRRLKRAAAQGRTIRAWIRKRQGELSAP